MSHLSIPPRSIPYQKWYNALAPYCQGSCHKKQENLVAFWHACFVEWLSAVFQASCEHMKKTQYSHGGTKKVDIQGQNKTKTYFSVVFVILCETFWLRLSALNPYPLIFYHKNKKTIPGKNKTPLWLDGFV